MNQKRLLLLASLAFLLIGLPGCMPPQTADESGADLYVTWAGQGGVSGYVPTGYGWRPSSKIEISIWGEPDGPGSASTEWKKVLDEVPDSFTMFGFNSGAPVYSVRRTFCGQPEQGQTMVFMAKSLTTGTIRMHRVPVDLYFTFQTCN